MDNQSIENNLLPIGPAERSENPVIGEASNDSPAADEKVVDDGDAPTTVAARNGSTLASVYDDCDDDEDDDDYSYENGAESDDSEFSDLSGFSDMSGQEWKPINKPMDRWVQKQIHSGANPRELLSQMLSTSSCGLIAPEINDMTLWRILASMLSEPPRRQKLSHINTIEDVISLLKSSSKIVVLTGAGVSVSCGIPDFRSSDGIYSRLAKDFPDLPDPQAMFDITYFSRDPRPFYKFAREIYPGQFTPSPCHRFIKHLETKGKLLRNYTQNIDTLEQVAGIKNVIECHGSFSTASCTKCKYKTTADAIRDDIFAQRIPVCPQCQPNGLNESELNESCNFQQIVDNGIMKPDIVFFGEGLPEEFHTVMASDKDECDLLIVIGSSLKVRPVALIPSSLPAHVPQILINREQLKHLEFDVELLGDSDVIINQLSQMLGDDWTEVCWNPTVLTESKQLKPKIEDDADTQSTKSNASEATPASLGFSDSGFESSASSFQPPTASSEPQTSNDKRNFGEITEKLKNDAVAAINKVKHGVIDFRSPEPSPSTAAVDNQEEDYDGETEDTCDPDESEPERCNFPYSRLAKTHTNTIRHLSVDSSKDSGICDSSNSVTLSSEGAATPQPRPNPIPSTSSRRNKPWMKPPSLAERLVDNTFYCRQSSCSYVFPGAQVSWSSDSEDDEDEDDDLAPLFDDDEEQETPTQEETPAQKTALDALSSSVADCGPPPVKRRKSEETEAQTEEAVN